MLIASCSVTMETFKVSCTVCSAYTNKFSQYSSLLQQYQQCDTTQNSLHFTTNIFLPFFPPLPLCFSITSLVQYCLCHHPLSQWLNFSGPTPTFPQHSPDLACFATQRTMFLGRFLVQPTHLLSGGPRFVKIWLILDLARKRYLDSENQDNIDNSL